MSGIALLVTSFVIALIGFIQSNRSKAPSAVLGLTKTGLVLVSLSLCGLAFSVHDQIDSGRKIDQIIEGIETAAKTIEANNPGAASALKQVGIQLENRERNFDGASFAAAIVSSADFTSAKMDQSTFQHAILTFANFSGADLRFSFFANADLSDSEFPRANFRGVDLTDIIFDETTKFPVR